MMGELKFFLGFQIKQMKEGTFLCQTKYVKDMLKSQEVRHGRLQAHQDSHGFKWTS
jgi:hypothetical protein